jgi:UDP-N-acetyl-D-galactosamine dehydrogenase
VLILGFTFKENCPDCRNTKVADIVKALNEYDLNITIYDPWASPAVAKHEYNIDITNELPTDNFDAIILAVSHNEFAELDVKKFGKENHVIFDVKGILDKNLVDGRL